MMTRLMPRRDQSTAAPGDPRLIASYRLQFFIYSIRHGLGFVMFVFFAVSAFQLGVMPMGYALLVLGLAYGTFVAINVRKLYSAWKNNERVRRENELERREKDAATAALNSEKK